MKKMIAGLSAWLIVLIPLWSGAQGFIEPGALRDKLPENTVAYMRLPNPWQLFTASEGSVLQAALSQSTYLQPLKNIQTALYERFLKQDKGPLGPSLALFLKHLNSPVEALFINPGQPPSPIPNVFISAQLDFASLSELNAFLEVLAQNIPELKVIKKLSAKNYGQLQTAFPTFLHYDEKKRLLNILSGMTATEALLTDTLKRLASAPPSPADHPMYALEKQVDTSRQGLFIWVNGQAVTPWVPLFSSPDLIPLLQAWGILDLRGLAFGWGIRDGKGRLSLLVDSPKTGTYREVLPIVTNQLNLTAAGQPHSVALLSLPTAELFAVIDGLIRQNISPEEVAEYETVLETFKKETGMSLAEALAILGPELVVWGDEVGEFMAVRLNQAEKWRAFVNTLSQRYQWRYHTQEQDGITYHHWAIAIQSSEIDETDQSDEPSPEDQWTTDLLAFFNTTHLFWIESEGYLVFGQVPQILKDQQRATTRVSLKQWLTRVQGQDPQSALLLLSTTLNQVPRHTYYGYIQLLNYAANALNIEFDLLKLPTALDLQLPKTGSYGLQVNVTDTQAMFEIVFDQTPFDFVYSTAGWVTAGLLGVAAVAIPLVLSSDEIEPANVQQQLQEGMDFIEPLKTLIEEYFNEKQQVPTQRADLQLSVDPSDSVTEWIGAVDVQQGVIIITYGNQADAVLQGQTLTFTPYETETGHILWRCGKARLPDAIPLAPLGTKIGKPAVYIEPTLETPWLPEGCY